MGAGDDDATLTGHSVSVSHGGTFQLAIRWVFPDDCGRHTWLADASLRLGRDGGCDVVLEGGRASRHHATIVSRASGHAVLDEGSRNGTFVNGQRVREARLSPGDVLRVGDWVGVVVARVPGGARSDDPVAPLAAGLLGSAALRTAVAPAHKAAEADLPVLLVGETGTGKERVARAVHEWSARPGPFVGLNCAALAESVVEGELFGYTKGAFTGAQRDHPGYFRSAHRGTLLLDEVTDLPLPVQAKLLRALEEGEVQPVGSPRAVPVDVRVVSAAQFPIQQAVDEGVFRADLYARLDGLTVMLPPLRARPEDAPGLFRTFWGEARGSEPPLAPGFVEALCLHDWPYNVRELRLLARRLETLLDQDQKLLRKHLPARMGSRSRGGPSDGGQPRTELEALVDALRRYRGNVARAAKDIGVSRQRAYRLLEAGDVDLSALRQGEEGGDE